MWLLILLSCVTKGTHELVQVQLDATRTALSARNAACYEDVASRDARIAELEERLRAQSRENEELAARFASSLEELGTARAQMAALATRVPKQIEEGDDPLVKAAVDSLTRALLVKSEVDHMADMRRFDHDVWVQHFAALAEEGLVEVRVVNGHTVVRIPARVLFNEGRVTVSPRGEMVLARVAEALQGMRSRAVEIVAHTDDQPYHTAEHDSSWELGFAEAMIVLRTLADANVPLTLSAASAAGTEPIAPNDTPEGRQENHRIELRVSQDLSDLSGMQGR
jgi:flagellar motor protein MotB